MPIALRNLDNQESMQTLPPVQADRSEAPVKSSGCCGGSAPSGADACCALDAEVKAEGGSGCGCGTPAASPKASGCC